MLIIKLMLVIFYFGHGHAETKIAGARGAEDYVWQTLHFWQLRKRDSLW